MVFVYVVRAEVGREEVMAPADREMERGEVAAPAVVESCNAELIAELVAEEVIVEEDIARRRSEIGNAALIPSQE